MRFHIGRLRREHQQEYLWFAINILTTITILAMPSEKFEVILKTLVPTFGEWTFFRLPLGQPLEMLHTMLHDLESFKEIFNNVQTESIVECLIADTKVWLQDDPQRAIAAAKLSSRLRLVAFRYSLHISNTG